MIHCPSCGIGQNIPTNKTRLHHIVCWRCKGKLPACHHAGSPLTLAFATAALILIIPSYTLPFMSLNYFGMRSESTILEGILQLIEDGEWFIGITIFLASVVVPIVKIVLLFMLGLWTRFSLPPLMGTRMYRFVEAIGRWSMLDIFVLAVIISLLKFGTLADAQVLPGAYAFLGVVIFTIIASANFNPVLLWRTHDSTT